MFECVCSVDTFLGKISKFCATSSAVDYTLHISCDFTCCTHATHIHNAHTQHTYLLQICNRHTCCTYATPTDIATYATHTHTQHTHILQIYNTHTYCTRAKRTHIVHMQHTQICRYATHANIADVHIKRQPEGYQDRYVRAARTPHRLRAP